MKLELFDRKKAAEQVRKEQPDEGDALKGKYELEDLTQRKGQHLVNEIASLETIPDPADPTKAGIPRGEEEIDTMLRQLSVITNGSGALGADFPITPENRVALEKIYGLTRWAHNNLRSGNQLRSFLERKFKDKYHTVFDRSIERDEPVVVLTYKPMLYPGQPPPPDTEANERRRMEAAKKP